MKKQILYILAFIFIPGSLLATDYTTQGNGTWTNTSTWDNTEFPDDASDNVLIDNGDDITLPNSGIKIIIGILEFNNNSILTIPENDTLVCDSMTIWNRADLVVDGVLIVNGGVHMNNNSYLNILLDGEVNIDGDFYGANNSDWL